ncbi:MAG TPA: bifunctional (p)ppGpp synthetase/guanosine-3',5'-bis(diphosphate) 3'-pyrophosphohydrolase [Caldisericia bacterium]|nr:bifunctional (p)ppGpp synthetase/guanosine-3',5'-bis(diphosphate) 3'-pyrophosphohydrolase [Caldisericia bacterium]HOW03105.1 bifunctional (p)ppGpp synthetase/guanosine-3',5'-bis(diphosphate) 3'-pyrophosphohydrolase [Caldisericia bacterium]HXK69806.1 bifunctional (p)ppGpp synthetase/guanosine-3',5'-bis(diphosphate) 3'-pyrophosphohydrolase [Caldisericia bacterium]
MSDKVDSFYEMELKPQLEGYLSKEIMSKIDYAFVFAREAHKDQYRSSGEPFILHPLNVAKILAEHHASADIIITALLHDVVEDTGIGLEEIKEKFGEDISELVKLLTGLKSINFSSEEEGQAENLRKLLLAMASDVRVVLIKIADRVHNMRTLNYLSPERQLKIAQETMDIYVPIVHRLGMYAFKWELEDLSFRYIHPEEYKKLAKLVAKRRKDREEYINKVINILYSELSKNSIKCKIEGRPKNLYSTYKKMERNHIQLNEVYDLFAVRVLVQNISDCYTVLGIIHNIWRPVPGRIKDYISSPKPNGYRSLHTTIFGPGEEPVEIQIRTFEMHVNDEVGIAAHWRYKEGAAGDKDFDEKVKWLRQLIDWHDETSSAADFVQSVKFDLFRDEIFVFTPKGKVIDLPVGATPIDFAYRIHTDIGNSCIGAKVNGRIAPLDYKLQTGDRVQILTSKIPHGPGKDWLNIARSASTRAKIKTWYKKLEASEEEAEKEETLKKETTSKVQKKPAKCSEKEKYVVMVDGCEDLPITFPKCCSPVPYDEIIGYISRGKGITIHRKNCPNTKTLEKDRIIPAHWCNIDDTSFITGLFIRAKDQPGVLAEVSKAISDEGINVIDLKAKVLLNDIAKISAKIEVKNIIELSKLMDKLSKLSCVQKVRRV